MTEDPVIICCSISGAVADREQCPAIPYTPAEYAAEARRIVDEGGVHIHIHARRSDGAPSYEVEDFAAITEAIRAEVGDQALINFSTGAIGVPIEKRIAYLRACRPEVAAVNMGSMNYAKYSARRRAFVFDMVFVNSFPEIIELLRALRELGIQPEHECFDLGHVGSLAPLAEMGHLSDHVHVDLVMGVVGGVPATARNLAAMADNVPAGAHWGVIGIGRVQWTMVAAALALGGSIRVGVEDNFYMPDGQMARSNGDLIGRARRMTIDAGRRPATVEEARGMLGVGVGVGVGDRSVSREASPPRAAGGDVITGAQRELAHRPGVRCLDLHLHLHRLHHGDHLPFFDGVTVRDSHPEDDSGHLGLERAALFRDGDGVTRNHTEPTLATGGGHPDRPGCVAGAVAAADAVDLEGNGRGRTLRCCVDDNLVVVRDRAGSNLRLRFVLDIPRRTGTLKPKTLRRRAIVPPPGRQSRMHPVLVAPPRLCR
jgi:uncharacterized protein (DUF849 family)